MRIPIKVLVVAGGLGIAAVAAAVLFNGRQSDNPWEKVVKERPHFDHSAVFTTPFETPQDVTRACLACHEDAAGEVMATAHWRWLGDEVEVPEHQGKHRIGKDNLLNNFCIAIRGNEAACTKCHAGYGWQDSSFDFSEPSNVDCLVCHERSGAYVKGPSGIPKEGTDLLAVAKSVGYPKRENCGTCHSYGGGGLGVKHGDLDNSLDNPMDFDDVHMGGKGMLCIDCHGGNGHDIKGRSISVSVDLDNRVRCTDCHAPQPHDDARLNAHTDAVACQTCHIPSYSNRVPTKMWWDWSKAGDDTREEDPHSYMKIKGEFKYEQDVTPEYLWFNMTSDRYLAGDTIDPSRPVAINRPRGDRRDPNARIWPFKVHRGKQPFDKKNLTLMPAVTSGEGGFWHEFNWDKALKLGAELADLPYSGEYDFAETEMFWPLTHMVRTGNEALRCDDCHREGGLMKWKQLGYDMDPMLTGDDAR